jgi:hypothetical protein
MSKPGKSLKALCKRLGVRLTVKRGKKRVYKSVAVLKRQCSNKKKKVVKRKRKFGTLSFPNPYMSVYSYGNYIGEKKDGKRHGKGIMYWNSGAIYKGDWVNDYRHGVGTFKFSNNGSKYDGEWKHDKANGKGTFTRGNGDKYVGEFKDNKKHGKGIMYGNSIGIIYKGNWENDLKHGTGEYFNMYKQKYKKYMKGVWNNNNFIRGDSYIYSIGNSDYIFNHFRKVSSVSGAREISKITIPHNMSNYNANFNPALSEFNKKVPLPHRTSEGFGKKKRRKVKKKKKSKK